MNPGASSPAKLVPELIVSDLVASMAFWCEMIGFAPLYDRPEDKFAYLDLHGAQVMLEQGDTPGRHWVTGKMESPRGRGINFQIEVADLDRPLDRLRRGKWSLFMEPEEKRYRQNETDIRQRQFLVQDPDGYLLRLVQRCHNDIALTGAGIG